MHDYVIQPWLIIPFGLLLGCIAVMPLLASQWWEHHYPKVALVLGGIPVAWYLGVFHDGHRVFESFHEYVGFICMVGALFVVSGGIHIGVKGEATPSMNVLLLLGGAILANLVGTTGASMILIRPFIRANKYRITAFHIIFFIFIVSNVGGCLTPVGDPPLYMGFMKGIPFFWTLKLLPIWLLGMGWLLVVFYIFDRRNFMRAPKAVRTYETGNQTWRFDGLHNVFWIMIILGSMFLQKPVFLREIIMVACAAASWFTTKREVHESNHFSWEPIKEVAFLFAGIFASMMPALDWLSSNAARLGIHSVGSFYWNCGLLSGVLDNAPTYLNFLAAAMGIFSDPSLITEGDRVRALMEGHSRHVMAISVAAVFFGACTYIGNGPNFMVRGIARHAGVHVPTFFGYIFKYTLPILLPMLVMVWWIFFRA